MVGTAQPLCLSASETEGRRYDMTMNLGKSEITAPHYNAGLDDEMPSRRRGSVFLDIPFYRTGLSSTENRAEKADSNIAAKGRLSCGHSGPIPSEKPSFIYGSVPYTQDFSGCRPFTLFVVI